MDENLSKDKHENVTIMDFNLPLVVFVVTVPRTDNNSYEPIGFEENSLQRVCI